MKKLWLLISLVGCASNPKRESATAPTPKLIIRPAPVFEMECQQRSKYTVNPAWQTELWNKAPRFQAAWDAQASRLIEASEAAAGRRFLRRELSVALVLCPWTPMADPFIVSALPYLEGSTRLHPKGPRPTASLDAFVSITHHELLHHLVENIETEAFANSSALVIKYRTEPFNVLVHLHLMAIQRGSYERLGLAQMLQETAKMYDSIGGDYKRAWTIVESEGSAAFLSELQKFNAGQSL